MTARAEYTRDEWILLITAPQAAIGAVAFADGTGILEIVGEGFTAALTQYRGKERFPGNELIAAIIDNKERIDPARLPQPQEVGESPDTVRDRLRSMAVEQCRDVMQLLTERSSEKERAGYAAWVMETAKAAAVAARHKESFFGASGPAVGDEERAMLHEIAEALGVEVGELPAAEPPSPDPVTRSASGSGPDVPSGAIHPS